MPLKPPLLSLGLISATSLAYEILLMRLFSIIQWHHFAYMIISLALLGYGISGTLVSILQSIQLKSEQRWFQITYPLCLFLFSIASFSCFFLAQTIPFNPEAILWETQQIVYLLSIFLLLSLPFLFSASAICLVFIQFPEKIAKVYSLDLIGAGLGSIGIIALLFHVFPISALLVISLCGLVATVLAIKETQPVFAQYSQSNKHGNVFSLLVLLTGVFLMATHHYWQLTISPYKDLSKRLNISGTKIIKQQSSPLGLLSVVESVKIPFRHAPGLSLYNHQEPPEQLGLFSDSANMTVITRYPDKIKELSYLDQVTSALPYHLKSIQRLLIVGAGGGSDILQAKRHKTEHIDALELNPQIINLMNGPYAKFSGALFLQDNINLFAEDVRGFLSRKTHLNKNNKHEANYDLIQITLMDSFNASASGLHTMQAGYLYTVEALRLYIQHLNSDGYLAISRWVKTPPRDTIKLFFSAIKALEKNQIKDVSQHLLLIRGWQTSTLMVKKSPVSAAEIKKLKQFCHSRAFDVAWYPGIKASEANQYNRFRHPWFYHAAHQLLNNSREPFLQAYKYNVYPATDDKPFFHHFFKWSVVAELLALREQGGLALIEMGYIVLFATLILAVISSSVLILLPLLIVYFHDKSCLCKKDTFSLPISGRVRLFSYFFSIGLAFLFIEIAMMQKFILFLYHPIYSIPIILTAFLVFSGIGSAWTTQLLKRLSPKELLLRALIGILCLGCVYSYFLNSFFALVVSLPLAIKIILSFILIAPLALCMGMPFPIGLGNLDQFNNFAQLNSKKKKNTYIPWAWGINGCASVISAILASLLAIHFGFTLVILFALGLYLFALFVFCVFPKS